ncbi:MAG TPA: LacI family DNA-binding transcriptional regulator [Capsulimonadaceae bacterium]|nr:LacI family DNA-binding transcriptional regulator [Capsulimonadaceae bacterium]
MRRFRKTTIKEVAERAGVSISTVSIFMNGREDVCSSQTADRIRAAVSALNYTPSSLVSGMQKHTTTTFGVCMHEPTDTQVSFGGFFIQRLWQGILSQADEEDYSILHYPASVRNNARYDAFLDGRVDGVLFHALAEYSSCAERVANAGMPTVLMTRSLDLPEGCGAVYIDETRTIDIALSHLWELGHRRIAHMAGPVERHSDIAVLRMDAYSSWMIERDCLDTRLIGHAKEWTSDHAAEIVEGWAQLDSPPTAVLCANDALALAVIEAAEGRGWQVPADFSVMGIDDSSAGHDAAIPLTTVRIAIDALGREAVRSLLRLINGGPIAECRVALPASDLVVRRSTGPSPNRS